MPHTYIACDLGAESGRVILGHLEAGKLKLEEIHRFSNGVAQVRGTLRWNVQGIFEELKKGLKKAAERVGDSSTASVSVDSWGVDYVLFREDEPQIGLPYHYRDPRTDASFERALKKVPREEIFAQTGIQFMSINTLYQFLDDAENHPEKLAAAERFLNIGDYFNYLFSGVPRAEQSLASTTQMYNPRERAWAGELLRRFGLPERLFPEIVPSGTPLGALSGEVAEETGLRGAKVIATCSHDTGCAVAATPAEEEGEDWAYLSSGTWSLLGVELLEPLIDEKARAANFTNEAGLGGTTRFLQSTAGLWILQECRRAWAEAGREFSYDELTQLAREAAPLRSLIDPNDPRFLKPGDMPGKICAFCEETGQAAPQLPGDYVRCILESLALLYRQNLETLRALTGRKIGTLHIVGGGSKNRLLNQLAADAARVKVVAGPVEATAIGNVLIQALALGHLPSRAALRQTVRDSFEVEVFQAADLAGPWEKAYETFRGFGDAGGAEA